MNQQTVVNDQYEEISLRELIDIVLDGKKIIAIVMCVTLLASIVASFFIMKPSYEAKTVLLTADVQVGNTNLENLNNVIDSYNKYPEMTVATYLEQVKSPEVLAQTIETLKLKDKEENPYTVQALASMIKVSNTKDTNLIDVTVTHKDPENAANIANALGKSFINFITENIRNRSKEAAKLLQEQLSIEEKNIKEATARLTEYLAESGNLTEMKNEMNSIIKQITTFKAQLNNVENSIIIETETLAALRQAGIKNTVKLDGISLDLNTSGSAGNFEVGIRNNNAVESAVLAMKMANIETSLVSNTSRKKVLDAKTKSLMEELITLQTKIAEEEYTYNAIQRDLSLANQAYNAYQQRHKEAILTAATDLGSTSVVVSSSAIVPTSPVSPRKALNLAIGLVLGLMMGVMITFFMHYWKVTSQEKGTKNIKA